MCGLAGAFALDPQARRIDDAQLGAMAARLVHRGPDAGGVRTLAGGRAGLAHRRLSIIDLEGGAQPMADETGQVWIAFNGEVFDHVELRETLAARGRRFRTRSDTEVVLQAYLEWGDDFASRLNGQFAIALVDLRGAAPRLVLVRDRVGILPLFHTRAGGRLLFASEIKALLPALPARPALDPVALNQIFTFWGPISPRTAFEGIEEVPPGRMLVVEDGVPRSHVYWRWEYPEAADLVEEDPDAAAETTHALLADAVRLRLRSDVPVGAYLSGGLDSSILAALARAAAGERVSTYAIRFAEGAYDEGVHQHRVAAHLDVTHAEILCAGPEIAGSFADVIRATESPVLRAAPAPMRMLSGLVRAQGRKVVLTGEGADEVFGGYDIFKETKIRRFWASDPGSALRPLLLRRLYPYMAEAGAQPLAHLKAFFGQGLDAPDRFDFSHQPRWRTAGWSRRFLHPDIAHGPDPLEAVEAALPEAFPRWHWFDRAQYLEATILLPNYLLNAQGDRMLMAHSVEGRFPFLDHRVIAHGNRLHPRLKMRGLDEKHVLKRMARSFLPPAVTDRPKQPYRAPDHAAFFGPGAPDWIADLLAPEALAATGLFDTGRVQMLLRHLRKTQTASPRDQMAFMGILSTALLSEILQADAW